MEERRIGLNFSTEVDNAIANALDSVGLKEGNTVYWIRGDRVNKGIIEEVCLGNADEECDLKILEAGRTNDLAGLNLKRFYTSDFGKELFFSKEQAEEVLANPNCMNPIGGKNLERNRAWRAKKKAWKQQKEKEEMK
jgi:hypothetical protein